MEIPYPSRQSLRLRNRDYSNPGIYYFTLVTFQREHVLGEIEAGTVKLNTAGRTILDVWNEIPSRYPTVRLLEAVVMPNHFHGMLEITRREAAEITASHRVAAVHEVEGIHAVAAIHELPLQSQAELPLQLPEESLLPLQAKIPLQEIEAQIQEEYRIRRRRMLLPKVIGYIKMNSARRINQLRNSPGVPVWQRNYYERIIRDGEELHAMQNYIRKNPALWDNE